MLCFSDYQIMDGQDFASIKINMSEEGENVKGFKNNFCFPTSSWRTNFSPRHFSLWLSTVKTLKKKKLYAMCLFTFEMRKCGIMIFFYYFLVFHLKTNHNSPSYEEKKVKLRLMEGLVRRVKVKFYWTVM